MTEHSTSTARGAKTRTANMNKRRAQILTCAGEIIAADGVDSLTLGKLASRADVTVPTIHNLIGRKKQIYELLVDEMVAKVESVLSGQDKKGLVKSTEAFTDSLIDIFRGNESLYRAAFIVGEKIGFFDQVSHDGIYQRSLKLAKRICSDAIQSGELEGRIESSQMARQIFACQRISRYDWMNGYIDLDSYRRNVLSGMYLTYGIDASPKMRELLVQKLSQLEARKKSSQ